MPFEEKNGAQMGKKKIGVTLPPALHDSIKMLAVRLGINIEEAYGEALAQYLSLNDGVEAKGLSAEAFRLARAYDAAVSKRDSAHSQIVRSAVMAIESVAELAAKPKATAPSPSRIPAHSRR